MTLPRLAASDLDGTLLRTDGTVSHRTVEAVRALQDAGIGWVVVTARPPRWLHDLEDVIGDHGIAICSNGGFVYDVPHRTVLARRTIGRDVVLDLVRDLRDRVPGIAFARESATGFGRESTYQGLHVEPDDMQIADIENLTDDLPGKLLARAPDLDEAVFLDTVADVIGSRAIVAFSGVGGLAEISAAGVTKASVLAEWCEERGFDAGDVVAFGDMPNDIPMLSWAGTSYAVANAHPDVKAVATSECGSNDDDGVAEILELLVAGRD